MEDGEKKSVIMLMHISDASQGREWAKITLCNVKIMLIRREKSPYFFISATNEFWSMGYYYLYKELFAIIPEK